MNPEEFGIGDLVEDIQAPGSQGVFTGLGYNGFTQVNGDVETKIAIVIWLKHRSLSPGRPTWRIWTTELNLLAKGKQNV
tara:strand:- start:158 stop:394 length:237 start_codon:yes stop_codon:yes gene_type:complete